MLDALLHNLEPFPETYTLEPGGVLHVMVSGETKCLALRFGMLDDGVPYVSVWKASPGQGRIHFERDGRDVFE